MSFSRYERYKDSKVEWLGKVPEHWGVCALKYVIDKIESGTSVNAIDVPALNSEFGVLKTSCVYRGMFDPQENKAVIPEEYHRLSCPVRAGKLIVSRMNTPDLVGAAGIITEAPENLFLPDRLWQVGLGTANPSYAYYWTQTYQYRTEVRLVCSGTSSSMQNLSQPQFTSFQFPQPPIAEQKLITDFLDRETAKIDALIAEQQMLIELLKEKRKAVISHAVTKGLNPDAPMKDSGVEWLGKVPEHWEVTSFKRHLIFLTSGSRGWAEHYSDEGSLFIRIGNLTRDSIQIDLSDIQRVTVPEGTEGERTKVQSGDVLFSITAYLGSVAVVPENLEPAYVSQHVALARLNQQHLLPTWAAYVTLSFIGKTYLETQGYGGTKIQLSLDDVANLVMTLPDTEEQSIIAAFLDRETAKLDALTAEAQTAITLLQERRTALISAAVTGKIDVRGFASDSTH